MAGYKLPKAPKKPTGKITAQKAQAYEDRVKAWETKCKAILDRKKADVAAKKKVDTTASRVTKKKNELNGIR